MNHPERTSAASVLPAVFELGGWRVFADRNEIEGPAGVVRLEPMSMRLLCLLAENEGRTVTRVEIVDRLWDGRAVTHDAVTRQIAKLREAFDDDARDPQVVKTVPKVGVRLLLDPRPVQAGDAEQPATAPAPTTPVPPPPRRPRLWPIVLGLAALTVGTGLGVAGLMGAADRRADQAVKDPVTAEVGLEQHPALSANGAWLASTIKKVGLPNCASEEEVGGLFVRPLARGAARRLTPEGVDAYRPAWSPDTTRLAFVQVDDRGCAVATVSLLDAAPRRIAACRATQLGGLAWLDARTLVVSDRPTPDAAFRLSRLDTVTGAVEPLTAPGVGGAMLGDTDPLLSADGKALYFVRADAPGVGDVHALDLESRRVRQVTHDGALIHGIARGEGERLVISSNRPSAATWSLWSFDPRGGDWRRLTDGARAEYPSSPDGRTVVFERRERQLTIWTAPVGGGALIQATATSRRDWAPTVARNGRLAFLSDRSGSSQLWLADTGGPARQISDFKGEAILREPEWSPDGRTVAVSLKTGEQYDLGLVDVASGALRRLGRTDAHERYPTWSRDGRWLYFVRAEGRGFALYRRGADGRETRLLGDAVRAAEGEDGMVYAQRLAAPGFWRLDPRSGGVTKIGDIPGVDPRAWSLDGDAIWAVTEAEPGQMVRLDLATGEIAPARQLPGLFPISGLAVRDGWVAFSRLESENVDVYALRDPA